jgi:hypothetical protein
MAMTVERNATTLDQEDIDFEEATRIYNGQDDTKFDLLLKESRKQKEELNLFELYEKQCALHTKNR